MRGEVFVQSRINIGRAKRLLLVPGVILFLVTLAGCSSQVALTEETPEATPSIGQTEPAIHTPRPTASPAPSPTARPTPGAGLEELLEDTLALDDGDALAAIADIVGLYPEQGAGYFAQAARLILMGDREAAVDSYQAGLTLEPTDKQAQRALFDLLQSEERRAQLKDILDQLIDAVPNDIELYMQRAITSALLGDVDAALADLQQVQEVLGQNSEALWVNAASSFYAVGDYQSTLVLTAEGLVHLSRSTDLLLLNGTAALVMGDAEAAVDAFDQLIEIDPQNFRAWHQRGVAHMLLGNSEKASADLEQAIAIGEDAGLMGANEAFEAVADLSTVLAMEDEQAGLLYLNQKEIFYVLNFGVRPRALMAGRARIYIANDQIDAALELLRRVIQRDFVEGYYYRAIAWQQIGETERAVSDLEAYLEIRPVGLVSAWARDLLTQLKAA